MKMNRRAMGLAAMLVLQPMVAMAHPGHGLHVDAVQGLLHPLTGLDHVLAMLAVGVFAAQLGGRALWAVPAAFVLAMVAGGALGYLGLPLPMVEPGIALSVIVMGLAVAFGVRLPLAPAMALVAAFAVFHGHAHGAEAGGSFLGYAAGFVIATAALHLAGIVLGRALAVHATRLAGATGALAGAALLLG